jgi:hypothetical protein
MRDYGRVYSTFWTSADMRALSEDAKLLALYLLSCAHMTIAGVCRLPDGYVGDDLIWEPERVAKVFAELSRNGFATRCSSTNWVWITKFLDWNGSYNPNQWKAARKIAASVPEVCSWDAAFQQKFAESAGDFAMEKTKRSQTVQKGLPSGSGTETETKSGSGSGSGATGPLSLTLEKIREKIAMNGPRGP